jgi:hypothetical protein
MAAKTFPNTKTNTTHLQTPARRILGDLLPNKSKNGDRNVAPPDPCARVMELDSTNDRRDARLPLASFRETPEEELVRDRRTLKRIAIGSLAAGGVAATIIHKGRVAKPMVPPVSPGPRTWPKLIHAPPKPKVARVKKVRPPSGFWTKAGSKARTALEVKSPTSLTSLTRPTNFPDSPPPRDRLSRARDVAIIGGAGALGAGALAAGGGALYAWRQAGGTLKQVRETVTPEAVAREGMKLVKRRVKQKAVEYFPTFSKWGGVAGRAMKRSFEESDRLSERGESVSELGKNLRGSNWHGAGKSVIGGKDEEEKICVIKLVAVWLDCFLFHEISGCPPPSVLVHHHDHCLC